MIAFRGQKKVGPRRLVSAPIILEVPPPPAEPNRTKQHPLLIDFQLCYTYWSSPLTTLLFLYNSAFGAENMQNFVYTLIDLVCSSRCYIREWGQTNTEFFPQFFSHSSFQNWWLFLDIPQRMLFPRLDCYFRVPFPEGYKWLLRIQSSSYVLRLINPHVYTLYKQWSLSIWFVLLDVISEN